MEAKFSESETLELKKSTSELKEAVVSIVSILNKHGFGEVYFGVKDDGSVVGQQVSDKTLRDVAKSISDNIEPKIYPEITAVKIEDKKCIYIKFSGDERPYYAYGRAYKRVGDEDRKLSAREIENLILKKHARAIKWESLFSDKEIDGLDEGTVEKFVKRANSVGRLEFEHENMEITLAKLELITEDRVLNAAEVLFCDQNPLEVQMAIFAGKDKLTFLDIKQLKGNIFHVLEQSELYIKNNIKWRVEFGKMEREEVPEIPVKAIREALVNSLCHRDYRIPKSNEIAIFQDRVEVYNPGDFPEGLTPRDFIEGRERSVLRNPLISQVLYFSKDVERWGSGLRRIYEECSGSGVKVDFDILKTGFLVTFYRKDGDKKFSTPGAEIFEGASEGIKKLYNHIKNNPGQRAHIMAEALDVPFKTVQRWISVLRDNNEIEFMGSSKTGGYFLKEHLTLGGIVDEGIRKLYEHIKNNPGHRARMMAEELDIPFKTVQRWIRKLRDDDKIKFKGSSKTGGYFLK